MPDLREIVTRKYGPLPVWAYVVAGAAAVFVLRRMRGGGASGGNGGGIPIASLIPGKAGDLSDGAAGSPGQNAMGGSDTQNGGSAPPWWAGLQVSIDNLTKMLSTVPLNPANVSNAPAQTKASAGVLPSGGVVNLDAARWFDLGGGTRAIVDRNQAAQSGPNDAAARLVAPSVAAAQAAANAAKRRAQGLN